MSPHQAWQAKRKNEENEIEIRSSLERMVIGKLRGYARGT